MKKPTMKREIAVDLILEIKNVVYFFATADTASEFAEYGELWESHKKNYWLLEVDRRFDFKEIVNYMQSYDSQNSEPLI